MKLRDIAVNVALALSVTAAVSVTAQSTWDRFHHSDKTTSPGAAIGSPVADWQSLIPTGHLIGPRTARLQIVEFADFECPSCAAYASVLDSVRALYPNDFAISVHHLPLPYHRLALPLARAAECADQQGKFPEFFKSVYAHSASIGVVPVTDFGKIAGVPDLHRFDRCVRDTVSIPRIAEDVERAHAIKVPGTPAIIVEGMLHTTDFGVRDYERLLSATRNQK